MHKNKIAPASAQSLLDSASNAAGKGLAQYFTPTEWGKALALALPKLRPSITDLECGDAHLLQAARTTGTRNLIGCDIAQTPAVHGGHFVQADICQFFPLLHAVKWHCDLFVLNPPWDLHWYREALELLAKSDCAAVRDAFAATDGRTSRETIDSSVATVCLALDSMPTHGEGMLIANEATIQRLILGKQAPHRALAAHVWCHLVVPGNICSDRPDPDSDFKTGIIYFARDHLRGVQKEATCPDVAAATDTCKLIFHNRAIWRTGAEIAEHCISAGTLNRWEIAAEEWHRRRAIETGKLPPYHLWLSPSGTIVTNLSRFDDWSGRVSAKEMSLLHDLNGKRPLQLVVMRNHRKQLQEAMDGDTWKVDPKLKYAVASSVLAYQRQRAPLFPLKPIMRLGYLDEYDQITCRKTVGDAFTAGRSYTLRSLTVRVERTGTKLNNEGVPDKVLWNGQELAFFVRDNNGTERLFMEQRMREKAVTVSLITNNQGKRTRRWSDDNEENEIEKCVIDFTLQEMVRHFEIPHVPDVAELDPEGYRRNLKLLDEIERLIAGTPYLAKKFQREGLARAALHDGYICGDDPGLGKTITLYLWPLLKLGLLASNGNRLVPRGPVLIVAPGDLHVQVEGDGRDLFKTLPTRLTTKEQFTQLALTVPRSSKGGLRMPPGFYLVSYTELTSNGVAKFPELFRNTPANLLAELNLKVSDVEAWFGIRGEYYATEYATFNVTPTDTIATLRARWLKMRKEIIDNDALLATVDAAFYILEPLMLETHRQANKAKGDAADWKLLTNEHREKIMMLFVRQKHAEFKDGIDSTKIYKTKDGESFKVRCIYSAAMADLAQDSFDVVMVDEGTLIKADESIRGMGVRLMNPPFRAICTGTPIKNRFPDFFWLAHWATGGMADPQPRFPYPDELAAKNEFTEEFMIVERNLTREKESGRRYIKKTPQVCSVHRAWKLVAPIVLRRRKSDIGEDIVKKHTHFVRVPFGKFQALVYRYHLEGKYVDHRNRPAPGPKLQALRIAASNPASPLLEMVGVKDSAPKGLIHVSPYSLVPKLMSALTLVRDILRNGEQVLIFHTFTDSIQLMSDRLNESGVSHVILDGNVNPRKRGKLAREFKEQKTPVALANSECMAMGHSFFRCPNMMHYCLPWAMDLIVQSDDRCHRINSPKDVNSYRLSCRNSIDLRIEDQGDEKSDASWLLLDGELPEHNRQEVSVAELLEFAERTFKDKDTIDERELVLQWPKLREELCDGARIWAGLPRKGDMRVADLPLWEAAA